MSKIITFDGYKNSCIEAVIAAMDKQYGKPVTRYIYDEELGTIQASITVSSKYIANNMGNILCVPVVTDTYSLGDYTTHFDIHAIISPENITRVIMNDKLLNLDKKTRQEFLSDEESRDKFIINDTICIILKTAINTMKKVFGNIEMEESNND